MSHLVRRVLNRADLLARSHDAATAVLVPMSPMACREFMEAQGLRSIAVYEDEAQILRPVPDDLPRIERMPAETSRLFDRITDWLVGA